jgi:hypothetical protein
LAIIDSCFAPFENRDGSLLEISNIDQSKFHYLKNYESISGKNAGWVFEQMEFEREYYLSGA